MLHYEYGERFKDDVKKLYPGKEMEKWLEDGNQIVADILERDYLKGFTFLDFKKIETLQDLEVAKNLIKERKLEEKYELYKESREYIV